MQTKLDQLKEELKAKQAEIEIGGGSLAQINQRVTEAEDLQKQIEAEQIKQDQEGRQQVQEEKVASVTLPANFSELFDDPRANDIIIELIRQSQRQAYEEHNVEVVRINAEWRGKLALANATTEEVATDRTFYVTDNERLKVLISNVEKENDELTSLTDQLKLEKQDAESKRDAAARELDAAKAEIEQHKSHINDLQEQLSNAPAPKAAIDISGSDKLSQLVKESNEAKAARGLQRWNAMLPEVVTPPVLPSLENNSAEVAALPPELPNVGNDFRQPEIPSGLGSATAGQDQGVQAEVPVTRAEFEGLKQEVVLIQEHIFKDMVGAVA
jgi:predicted  nucleic acid-binding Zn-ribbon protein